MKRSHSAAIAIISLLAVTAFAGGLYKYKGWDKSPQGDLMTSAERTEWANVKSDEDADKFVKEFLAKRGPGFVAEVDRAAAAADKYFTTGKTPGSLTERGRLVIVLGPPDGMTVTNKPLKSPLSSSTGSSLSNANGGGPDYSGKGGTSAGASTEDYLSAKANAGAGDTLIHVYTFTYSAKRLPSRFDNSLTATIEVDPGGKERLEDRKTQADLAKLYELVAESKIVQPSAKPQ